MFIPSRDPLLANQNHAAHDLSVCQSSLIESLKTASTGSTPPYKFAVSVTVIQNGLPGASKRGMNVSMGAFWNSETDGLWSYKYESGEKIGLDVVVNVIWMAY
jgi:hypothetical protein